MTASRSSAAVAVRYFGPLMDITGTTGESVTLQLPDTVGGIRDQLLALRPGLQAVEYRIAVDETVREPHEQVAAAREVALLPAFSGG